MTWDTANTWAAGLTHQGFTDWNKQVLSQSKCLAFSAAMGSDKPEPLLLKADVDFTFSMNKAQWAITASQIPVPEGWTLRIYEHETGAQVIAVDSANGTSLSIQPLFENEQNTPLMVIVRNYLLVGLLPPLTDVLKKDMELTAQNEIGAAYSLTLNHTVQGNFEIIEFRITEN